MASIETRAGSTGTTTWRVIWREAAVKQSERFDNATSAEKFQRHVEAAGDRWPPGWIPRKGWAGTFKPDAAIPSIPTTQFVTDSANRRVKASEGTRANYVREVDRYINGTQFGQTPWQEVTAATASDWIIGLTRRGLSPKTIKNCHGLASSSWKEAIRAGNATLNPLVGLAPRVTIHSEDIALYLTPSQFLSLYEVTPEHYKLFVHCLAATGMRFSEMTALRVKNIDGSLVKVREAWKKSAKTRVYVLGTPKTARSRRDVTIDEGTREMLAAAIEGKHPDDFVFTTVDGDPINYDRFYQNIWRQRACAALTPDEFPRRPKPHDLRHTHCSWLIGAGASMLEVSRRAGHKDIGTTANTYGHLFPNAETGLAQMGPLSRRVRFARSAYQVDVCARVDRLLVYVCAESAVLRPLSSLSRLGQLVTNW